MYCNLPPRGPPRLLLDDLSQQSLLPIEIVVVDNDAAGSARTTVDQYRERVTAYPIHYDIQPARNIALTRNRTVELATAEWLAFIDDDERAPHRWLSQLAAAVQRVLGRWRSWPCSARRARRRSKVDTPRPLLRFCAIGYR